MKYAHWPLTLLWFCIFAVLIVATLTPFGSATTPDSLSYLDIASNIAAGNEAKASDFSLTTSATRGLVEQRTWPPLYPAALSLFIQHTTGVKAAAWLSMLLLATTMFMVFLLLTPSMHWGTALLLASAFGITIPILTVYTFAWSETLFVPLMLVAAWSASRYVMLSQSGKGQRLPTLVVLLFALSMLAYTRYIGVVFSLLLPIVLLMSRRESIDRKLLAITGLFYSIVVGYLLVTNLVTTGHLSGIQRQPSNEGMLEVFASLKAASMVLVPQNSFIIGITLIIVLLLTWFRYKQQPSSEETQKARTIIVILATSGMMYLGALITLRSQYQFDNIDTRLLAPAFVAFFCLLALAPWAIAAKRKATIIQLFAALLITMPTVQGYTKLVAVPENWLERNNPGFNHNAKGIYNNFTRDATNDPRRQLFVELMEPGGVLVTTRPVIWEFISGFRSMQKPVSYDAKTLQTLNALPDGSLLVMPKHEFPTFQANIDTAFNYVDLGQHIGVPFPATFPPRLAP